MKKTKTLGIFFVIVFLIITAYYFINERKVNVEGKVVLCIPVYGQSLALGEEAERITDFSTFIDNNGDRIVTEDMDQQFGYFEHDSFKRTLKRFFHYRKRAFELSVYAMSQSLVAQLGKDTIICTFPGGQGATAIANLSKGTGPYDHFISDIKKAHQLATEDGARFSVPAICWMQGESDIADYPDTDYKVLLKKFSEDVNHDIQAITHQTAPVRLICYQANALTRAERFTANNFDCAETGVPQSFIDLLLNDTLFWASGPTYPYNAVREAVHIDAIGQQHIGHLAAQSAMGILHEQQRFKGLIPQAVHANDSDVIIRFNVPRPPLTFDTIQVAKAEHYGFSVITPDNTDIANSVLIDSCCVRIKCSTIPIGCKVRYAINGEYMKSGNQHGPRGNLRDSQGDFETFQISGKNYPLHNWGYQFDIPISEQQK